MLTYNELLAMCTEFQENFSSLNGKYNATMQELKRVKEENERLAQRLETVRDGDEKLRETIHELKRELEEANTYKDRYVASTVTVEHLKGRLENARRAVADKMMEHEQEVEQLRNQIKDLLERVNVCTDAQATQKLKQQVVELEERCVQQNSYQIEERERSSQQILTAHTTLREQQARQLELEQRCRTLEGEIAQMRSVVRRSADLQNDAAVAREKSASEARRAAMQAESLAADLRETQAKLRTSVAQHEDELEAARAAWEEEKSELLGRVSQLSVALDEAAAVRVSDNERYAALQRSVHERVEAARADARLEVAALQKSLSAARGERQQFAWRAEQAQAALEECRQEARQRTEALEKGAAECRQLRIQLDTLAQREGWLAAEREHILSQLAASRRQVQELTLVQQAREQSDLEAERLRVQVQFLEDEVREARRIAEASGTHARDIEEAGELRLRALRNELKTVKKQARADRRKADAVRRRLVQALLERNADVLVSHVGAGRQRPSETVVAPLEQRPPAAGLDVLALLRGQSEQAEALHHRLVELSR